LARILAEVGRAEDEDLQAIRPGLVASPRPGWDPDRVPLRELDDLVVELHPPAPAHDDVYLLLLHVRVAVRKPIAGRDALVAQGGLLELERLGRRAELEVRRAVEPRADVLQIRLDVPERERHGTILCPGVEHAMTPHDFATGRGARHHGEKAVRQRCPSNSACCSSRRSRRP
jgi:hypothetical protein